MNSYKKKIITTHGNWKPTVKLGSHIFELKTLDLRGLRVKTIIEKDGDGYLAKIEGHQNLFAFAYSEKKAVIELKNVVEMIMDYHLEQANDERIIKNELTSVVEQYAVQV